MRRRPHRVCLDLWLALAVGIGTLAGLLITLDEPAITWDEGFTIRREERVREWFALLSRPRGTANQTEPFAAPVLDAYWPFAREEPDGHPPFYALIGDLGWLVGHRWLPALEAHRLGPVVLFSVTVGVMYLFLARRFGRLAGVAASGSLLLMPRIFAHAHLASYDMPLACLWFLTVAAFWKARETPAVSFWTALAWSVVFAVMLALAAATKFTGWLIPLPLVIWSAIVGMGIRSHGGAISLRRLIPLILCGLPLLVAVPEVVRMLRQLGQTDATLEARPGENVQIRATRVAATFRAQSSPGLSRGLWLLPVLVWCGVVAYQRWRVSSISAGRGITSPPSSKAAKPETRPSNRADAFRNLESDAISDGRSPLVGVWTTAVALTPAITVGLIPNWWHDPQRGLAIFLWSNLTRQKTTWIPTEFFGTTYEFALPWYNTLAWVALTVPPGILLLVMIAALATLAGYPGAGAKEEAKDERRKIRDERREHDKDPNKDLACSGSRRSSFAVRLSSFVFCRSALAGLAWLLLLNAATLLVIRALPNAPGHDGERQLLGSFPFLACLAGTGAESLRRQLGVRVSSWFGNGAAWGLVVGSMVWAAMAVWHYRTAPLSYYTELIGGLRGAARLGLEPTYYWDALDQDTLDWLNTHTGSGEKVLFCSYFDSLRYLRQWGKLRVHVLPDEPGAWRWYVLQNRPGLFAERPWDRWLAEHGRPASTRLLDGVPLVWIFSIDEYDRARSANDTSDGH